MVAFNALGVVQIEAKQVEINPVRTHNKINPIWNFIAKWGISFSVFSLKITKA